MSLLGSLKENPFVLAPMAGITDKPFRSFMRKMGCGVVVTELVSATGLRFSSEKTRRLMEFSKDQHPIGIQIFGDDLQDFAYAAQCVEQMGADFVDLNFGCPVPKVVKKGGGAAVLKDPLHLRNILRTVKSSVSIPVTIKIRTGWDQQTRNAGEVCWIAFDEGMTWVSIHGRTRAQGYTGASDWDFITEIKRASPLPVLGNGDIVSGEMARRRLLESTCDGVLIGRGCLKNPWIFQEARGLPINRDFESLFTVLRTELEQFYEDRLVALQLKKLSAWYAHGYPGASSFRKSIFQASTKDQAYDLAVNYFEPMKNLEQKDTSDQAFLMGGHG